MDLVDPGAGEGLRRADRPLVGKLPGAVGARLQPSDVIGLPFGRGGLDVVWPTLLALLGIGAAFFVGTLRRLRSAPASG